ncbi:MAG: hypothetical protein AABY46_04735, partial [Nitrospirota bacterium]
MVQKIRKKVKKGPKAPHAVPLAIVMTALYGFERKGRDFRQTFEDPVQLRAALRQQLDQEPIPADRVLSFYEYRDWGLKSAPGRLSGMFSKTGLIPMGPPLEEEEASAFPQLGILPTVAIVKAEHLESFSGKLGDEWHEVARVAFQNSVYPTFNLIPGYDLLLYMPICHARDTNRAITALNHVTQEAFDQAGRPYPGPFQMFPVDVLARIPLQEPISG